MGMFDPDDQTPMPDTRRQFAEYLERMGKQIAAWDATTHDDKYVAALLAGQEPPPNLIHETTTGAHIYQRDDDRYYHWPEETLF